MERGVHLRHRPVATHVSIADQVTCNREVQAAVTSFDTSRNGRRAGAPRETGEWLSPPPNASRLTAIAVQRRVRLGVREQRHYGAAHRLERPRWRPRIALQDVETDLTYAPAASDTM
eukprot:scaffold869_cov105-Isochrysis_galbana.AAC.49